MVTKRNRNEGEVISRSPREHENRIIQNVLNNFDFKMCHDTMKFLNWEWAFQGIPSIDMLKISSEERLRRAMELAKKGKCSKSTYYCSSGGLKANAWLNRYGYISGASLEFVLTDWDSDGDI